MKLADLISTRTLAGIAIAALGLCISSSAHAQEAVAAFNGYNSAFLVQNGQTFYAGSIGGTTPEGEWGEALDIQVALDAYRHTHSAADRNLGIALLNSLTYYNGPNSKAGYWIGDGWDDNLAWMANVYIQGYLLFGTADYMTQAEAGWNNGYNLGWDTSKGGIWEERPNDISKCMLSNGTFVWEGVQITLATGDTSYLTKAEQIYEWTRSHLVNTTGSSNNLGAPGQVNGCTHGDGTLQGNSDNMYDNGIFIEAATALYKATGNSEYSTDAVRTINHVMGEGSIIPYAGSGEAGHAWEYWVFRGLSDYATASSTWSTYQSYILNNANAAWNERNTQYNITWNNWSNLTSLSGAEPNEMSSAAAIWQHLPPPGVNLSGTWEIQNVNSGLALEVSGASKSNKAAIVQEPFAGGNNAYLWTFKATSGGYYQIINVNSGEALNVAGSSGLSKALIDQWPPEGSMNPGSDEWLPVVNPDGSYSFYNLNSYEALDVPGGSTTAGTQLQQYYGNGGTNQEFKLISQ